MIVADATLLTAFPVGRKDRPMYFRVIEIEGESGKWKIRIALTKKNEHENEDSQHEIKVNPAACRDLICTIAGTKDAVQSFIEKHTFTSVYAANAFYQKMQAHFFYAA